MSVKQKIEMEGSLNAKYVSAFQDKIILSYWCYPRSVKMIDRTGNLIWSRNLDIIPMCPFFEVAPCIVSFFEDNNPKLIAAKVEYPFLKQGLSLVKLDAKTGEVIKIKQSENLQPRGVDVDIESGILYFLADHTVWGSTLDLEHQRELLTTKTGLSVGSHNFCFNRANQQLLVATNDIVDRFQMVV